MPSANDWQGNQGNLRSIPKHMPHLHCSFAEKLHSTVMGYVNGSLNLPPLRTKECPEMTKLMLLANPIAQGLFLLRANTHKSKENPKKLPKLERPTLQVLERMPAKEIWKIRTVEKLWLPLQVYLPKRLFCTYLPDVISAPASPGSPPNRNPERAFHARTILLESPLKALE